MTERHIYLDHAASTPLDQDVMEAMLPFMYEHTGNPSSTHHHGRLLRTAIEQSRRTIAGLLHAQPSEIIFTGGGTEADNIALVGAVFTYDLQHIISTQTEHHAVTHTLEYLKTQRELEVHWLSVDSQGHIDLEELRRLLSSYPGSLVSLMHGNNEIGTLHNIRAISELCTEYHAVFHSDTVQTMGHVAYDLSELNVDLMAASAHKFYGPKSTGFLYMKKGHKLPSLIHGGGQERNIRPGTENVAGIVGMAKALEKCYANLEEKNRHLRKLKYHMHKQLRHHIDGIEFNGDLEVEHSLPTVLNVAFPGEEQSLLTFQLDIQGISASGGSACSSGASTGSHVLKALGHSSARIANSVRFSFGIANTMEEIDYAIDKIIEIAKVPV